MVDTNAIRERLLRRREELRKRASDASAEARHESDPLSADFAEQVTQRENDDVLGAISDSARAELEQVNGALRRLASGRYGTCVVCGGDDRARAPRGRALYRPLPRLRRARRRPRNLRP